MALSSLEKAALVIGGIAAIIGLAALAAGAKAGGFHNDETWSVGYDEEGNITSIHVQRKIAPNGAE